VTRGAALHDELRRLVGDRGLAPVDDRRFWVDATESQGIEGTPAAVVLPADAEQVSAVVAWCHQHAVPIVPRGGGTGFAGGCVPTRGSIVLGLERMRIVHTFDPHLWRIKVDAGLTTAELRRLARENGLSFPPDPGAAEQSQIGGNIATDAGGPHALKYGTTGAWVMGVEAVLASGERIAAGGGVRKDVAGYDLTSLMTGSEGTLGIICAAWLRLIPAPEASRVVVVAYDDPAVGCAAVAEAIGSGLVLSALEFLDRGAITAAASFPFTLPTETGFLVIAEADGSVAEAEATVDEAAGILGKGAVLVHQPTTGAELTALWRWRDGVSGAVTAVRGGKVSDDIAVPVDRLAEAVAGTVAIGAEHCLEACSWGHAGDGNLHSTFLVDSRDKEQLERARRASSDLYDLALRLGGTISGEHGIGTLKRAYLDRQRSPQTLEAMRAIKRALDPDGTFNPGKSL
jgi:glycolate oxidase subunit GlcD